MNGFPLTQGFEYRTNDGASVDYTATLSPTLVLDLRGNMSRFVQERRPGCCVRSGDVGLYARGVGGDARLYVPAALRH